MSRSGKTRLFFGEGDFDFRLTIGQCAELQDLTKVGLMVTLERVTQMYLVDIGHVLRLGLIGGGMAKEDAFRLVARHMVDGYFRECGVVALDALQAAIMGVEEEPLGEEEGRPAPPSPTDKSDTPASTEPEPQPA